MLGKVFFLLLSSILLHWPVLCQDPSFDYSNYDDLDSFLSDLPRKTTLPVPFVQQFTTELPDDDEATTEPPPPQCYLSNKPMVFPPNLFSNKSSHYPFQESGLQIFLGLKIPCDGLLTAWQFLSAHTVIWGLHFGVFRRTCFDVFQLVSDTYINGQTTGTIEEKWVAWKPTNPIPVKRGDVIGIFYDRVNTATKSVSVRSVTLPDNYKYAPKQIARSEALVFLADAQSLAKTHGCVRLGSGRLTRRIPALFILMTPEIRGGRLVPAVAPVAAGRMVPTTTNTPLEMFTEYPITPPPAEIEKLDNGFVPIITAVECNQLPKFDYACDISLGVRYYYDKISKVCRQFLYCPTSRVASTFGFGSQADCDQRCSSPGQQNNDVALVAFSDSRPPHVRSSTAKPVRTVVGSSRTVAKTPQGKANQPTGRMARLQKATMANSDAIGDDEKSETFPVTLPSMDKRMQILMAMTSTRPPPASGPQKRGQLSTRNKRQPRHYRRTTRNKR